MNYKLTKNKRTSVTQVELNNTKQDEEKIKSENDFLDLIYSQTKFDLFIQEKLILQGIQGHINYISKTPIEPNSKIYYFELTINDLSTKFNSNYFFSEREVDSYSRDYYEKVKNKGSFHSNVRFGLIHESKNTQVSVGSDEKSYAFRAVDGVLITEGEEVEVNDCLREGETVTLCVLLKPPKPDFLKKKDKIKNGENLHSLNNNDNGALNSYGNKHNIACLEKENFNSDSFIKFYIDGKEQENHFNGLYEGKYYLVVTLYNKAVVSLNTNQINLKYTYN